MKFKPFALLFVLTTGAYAQQQLVLYPKKEYAKVLSQLVGALTSRQIMEKDSPDVGAIRCEHCTVLHTRAAEALFPFAISYKITKDPRLLRASIQLGNWLIKQQCPDGSWKETPEEWTGTSTDQLLMMILTYERISDKLTPVEDIAWKRSMTAAADYLTKNMSPEFASINYCATTTATLAAAHRLLGNGAYVNKARSLAHRTIAKMDEDGFINGEGGKSFDNKFGVDLGYDMEMSLWGLGLYAKITSDTLVDRHVKHALVNHFYFIYPDGSLDGSWGIRSNKWTTYGGATSDGCQTLFSLYADVDPAYMTASLKNLDFMTKSMKGGLVGYGPHYWTLFSKPPCIYPTFAKAKNLALAYELESNEQRPAAALPTERTGWMRHFKTLDVVEVRTQNFLASITAYRYKDVAAGPKSKYMHRPTGGSISNLWLKDHGYLTASSQTVYSRPEPMHFPEVGDVKSLTPQITFTDSNGTFTNLYEYDGRIEARESSSRTFEVTTIGELKNKQYLHGGVGYRWTHLFTDTTLTKTVTLYYRDSKPAVTIVEPIVETDGAVVEQRDPKAVRISTKSKVVDLVVEEGNVLLSIGKDRAKYFSPYPALQANPITLTVAPPTDAFVQRISYRIELIRGSK